MPRPQKCRRICSKPEFTEFSPDDGSCRSVVLTLDEFEVVRLVDLEKQTHEQCAKQMEISRSTVTEIYESAREKLADCLVNGYRLTISGGNYKVCDGSGQCFKNCSKARILKETEIKEKGEDTMRIAVTYENGEVFQHFGHTAQFKVYDIEDGKITASAVTDTYGSGHGALAGFLASIKTDVLICGGIGGGAKTALAEAGIKLYGGVQGSADEAVNAFIAGALSFNPDVHCSHHDHECGGEEHTCGEHSCI